MHLGKELAERFRLVRPVGFSRLVVGDLFVQSGNGSSDFHHISLEFLAAATADYTHATLEVGGVVYHDVRVTRLETAKPPGRPKAAGPEQGAVDQWLLQYFQSAADAGKPAPKLKDDAMPACKTATGATDLQIRMAGKNLPDGLKRKRGQHGKGGTLKPFS